MESAKWHHEGRLKFSRTWGQEDEELQMGGLETYCSVMSLSQWTCSMARLGTLTAHVSVVFGEKILGHFGFENMG